MRSIVSYLSGGLLSLIKLFLASSSYTILSTNCLNQTIKLFESSKKDSWYWTTVTDSQLTTDSYTVLSTQCLYNTVKLYE